ncbi:hypothetical protein NDU88_012938 [Pleurodeles waltl]|uniref:Uncharacterized protein n=1 Tax=Pleurodeles waltl TaxID=8319 RepID=A0AAV7R7I4_PLEWA|nr:hypothetical protein NDU88_012938 [Pleurodeles waltl]
MPNEIGKRIIRSLVGAVLVTWLEKDIPAVHWLLGISHCTEACNWLAELMKVGHWVRCLLTARVAAQNLPVEAARLSLDTFRKGRDFLGLAL